MIKITPPRDRLVRGTVRQRLHAPHAELGSVYVSETDEYELEDLEFVSRERG